MMNKDDSLRAKLDRGDFVVTAEVTPKLSASAADLIEQARCARRDVQPRGVSPAQAGWHRADHANDLPRSKPYRDRG
jgi:hypothetical protein